MAVGLLALNAGEESPVTGDCHAGIFGSRGLRCPRPPAQADVSADLGVVVARDEEEKSASVAALGLRRCCNSSWLFHKPLNVPVHQLVVG
jgi:hypothetical protein